MSELVILRLLVDQAQAVVERELAIDLPVVLDVALGVAIDEAAFDIVRELVVGAEHAHRGVRESKAAVERVAGVVGEGQRAGPPLALLRLEAVRVIEAALDRVRPLDARDADGNVVGRVLVEEPRERYVRRRIGNTIAPRKRRWHHHPAVHEVGRLHALQRFIGVIVGVDDIGVGKEERESAKADVESIAGLIHRERVLTECRARARLCQRTSRQLVLRMPIGRFEKCRRSKNVVHGHGNRADRRLVLARIVEPWNRPVDRDVLLLPPGYLKLPRSLVVGA